MTRTTKIALFLGLLAATATTAVALPASGAGGSPLSAPRGFFGIVPQTSLTQTDAEYMRAGGIGTVRWPLAWGGVQPTAKGEYQWGGFDEVVKTAALQDLQVLPFIYSTPAWLSPKYTTLPVATARQRTAWSTFVRAAVERYGPRGQFWREHGPRSAEPVPKMPIHTWQIWNEANFFYFAYPVSPSHYAQTLELAHQAVKSVDPSATVMLSGLFGEPDQSGLRGMSAVDFLEALYQVPGIKSDFDAIALHPYAVDAETLAELTEGIHEVALDNHDPETGIYITEMGWGSQNDYQQDAFEQGVSGQVKQLRDSYEFLLENRYRLNLKGVYWFTWQDVKGSCNFCDSTGLFSVGKRLRAKPAWRTFVGLTGGQPAP